MWTSLVAQIVKSLPAVQETGFDPWVGKIPWRRKWQPTPVFLPGEFHGWRSLVGYSPWDHKESDMTQRIYTYTWCYIEFSRQEYWSGVSFPSPGDLPHPGIKPGSPTLQADFFTI